MALKSFCQYLLLCIILIASNATDAFSQSRTITGVVKSDSNEVLSAASVNLVNERSSIISFSITNQKGEYALSIPSAPALLWLEVSYIGYKKQRMPVEQRRVAYDFILTPDTNTLSAVTAKNRPPIQSLGDTIRYYVQSFAQKEDRSIGDVLRRMPGITVDVDGTIYYNGRKVENLYIQGDDLMDGRYGVAPKVIRKELISNVDVIRNHQPIQVLRGKDFSDKTTINLVLKDEKSLKLSAKGMVGAGLPEQYDVSLTPLLLNERIKTLNILAMNNSGVDYKNDFKQLGSSNMVANIASEPPVINLSLATIGPPDLPLANYYFNKSGIVNLNSLYKTKKAVQYKSNFQFFYDNNTLNFYSRAENYLPGDTVTFREQQAFTNKPLLFNSSLNMMINKERYFFNNNIKVNLGRNLDNSSMNFNDYSFQQRLRKTVREFSNDLNWIPALRGKGIGELRWLISYNSNKQLLDIGDGYYSNIINHQGYYDHVKQMVEIPTLFSHTYFSYRMSGKVLNQEYRLGYIVQSQTMASLLSFEKNGLVTPYSGDPGNDLRWRRHDLYLSEEYQLKYKKLVAVLRLPLTYRRTHYYQQEYGLNSNNNDLIFTPSLTTRYDLTTEQTLSAKYGYGNTFGNMSNVYRGTVLQNFRVLQANNAALQEKSMHSASVSYDFQKSITMLFLSAGLSWDGIEENAILSTEISDNVQRTILLPYKNRQRNTSLNLVVSKYLFNLKSTVSLKSQWGRSQYTQLINGAFLPFYSDMLVLNGSVLKKMFGTVNLTYQPNCLWSFSKLKDKGALNTDNFSSRAFRIDQNMAVGFTVKKRLYVEINGRHNYTTQTNSSDLQYFFMDAKLRLSNTKKKIDMNLDVTNLFNIKNYTRYGISANRLIQDEYTIRGRMVILRMDYYF